MTKMNAKSMSFAVAILVQCMVVEAEFSPVKRSPSLSEQCGEHGNPDLSGVLTTLTKIVVNNKATSSLPKSCMEIKESSPVSPSGYYTISNGSGESGVVVYCDMDDLFSCPALEQTLSRIKEDVDSLFTHIDNISLSSCIDGLSLVSSCLGVKERCPQCKSGVYEIGTHPKNVTFVYCALENSTYCNVTGPWVKLASWNISESGSSCPNGLQLFVNGTVSACGIQEGTSGGHSLPFLSSPVQYTQVCGRMMGYQKGSTDAFQGSEGPSIDGPYVDGVSITRGLPRQHIWTYAIGVRENLFQPYVYQCPCLSNSTHSPPSFVGSDYFCESGCPAYHDSTTFYAADPLWDGEGCGFLEAECCAAPGLPWFHKVLDTPTTDHIETRLCSDEGTANENVLISSYDIYVL